MFGPHGLFAALGAISLFVAPSLKADLITAGSATVQAGAVFTVPVTISAATDVFDFQFDVAFNTAILQLQSVTEGPFLMTAGSTTFFPGFIDNTAGNVTFIADALNGPGPGAAGSGTLAFLNFEAAALGTSALTLSDVILQDPTGADIPFTAAGGSVTVVAGTAPEPSPALAACLCLFAVWLYGLRGRGTEPD